MSLSADDIGRLELKVRTHADRLRKDAGDFEGGSPGMAAHARFLRQDADGLDMVADLLVGLQGDWDRLGPMVRDGFKRIRGEFERRQAFVAALKAGDEAA